MDAKLQKAHELFRQNKFEKVLKLLKKHFSKPKDRTYDSAELEGVCLVQTKKPKLARITLERALTLAVDNKQLVAAHNNIAFCCEALGDLDSAIRSATESLALDGTFNNIRVRAKLSEWAHKQQQHKLAIESALPLLSSNEYVHVSLLILINSYFALNDSEQAGRMLDKALALINEFSERRVVELLKITSKMQEFSKLETALERMESKFGHLDWFTKTKRQLDGTSEVNLNKLYKHSDAIIPATDEFIVKGNNKALIKEVETYIALLQSSGARFHKDLVINVSNGELSVHYDGATEDEAGTHLMSIPIRCMPILSDYIIELEDMHFKATLKPDAVNPDAAAIMVQTIHLYNKTKKASHWAKHFPLYALKHLPDIVRKLCALKVHDERIKGYLNQLNNEEFDLLLKDSFIASRQFSYKKIDFKKQGIDLKKEKEHGLLTVIDFLNHRIGASGYVIDGEKGNMEISARADPDTKEVFVQYNYLDPVSTYLQYGFVDTNCPWISSIPIEISTSSGVKINILNLGVSNKKAEEHYQHLSSYMPALLNFDGKVAVLANFNIPIADNTSIFEQVIRSMLKNIDEDLYENQEILFAESHHIKRQLLNLNLSYWNDFRQKVEAHKNNISDINYNDLATLCELGIKIMSQLMQREGITAF